MSTAERRRLCDRHGGADLVQNDALEVDAVVLPSLDVYAHDATARPRPRRALARRARWPLLRGAASRRAEGNGIRAFCYVDGEERLVIYRHSDGRQGRRRVRAQIEGQGSQVVHMQLESRAGPVISGVKEVVLGRTRTQRLR